MKTLSLRRPLLAALALASAAALGQPAFADVPHVRAVVLLASVSDETQATPRADAGSRDLADAQHRFDAPSATIATQTCQRSGNRMVC